MRNAGSTKDERRKTKAIGGNPLHTQYALHTTPHSQLRILSGLLLLVILPALSFTGVAAQTSVPRVSAPFQLGNAAGSQDSPSLAGNALVYSECANGVCNIWGLDLANRQPYQISQGDWNEFFPSTDGVRVVWTDGRNLKGFDTNNAFDDFEIYGANLGDKKEFAVTTAPRLQSHAVVWGNVAVWSDFRDAANPDDPTAGNIYMSDLASNSVSQVSNARSAQIRPVTNGRYIVWVDYRNEPSADGDNSDIYAYDLATKQEFPITIAPGPQLYPAISGNTVVWSDWRRGDGTAALYGFDLANRREFLISASPGSKLHPSISGNLVVWEDNRNEPDKAHGFNNDIYAFDIATNQEFRVYAGPGWQGNPVVSGGNIVWEDNQSGDLLKGDYHLMGATVSGIPLSAPEVAPPLLPGPGSAIFPETGRTITGIFLGYWQRNGGIPQQGYPISQPMTEVSDLDGKTYIVQYFERAVFEWHPENQPPNNVLLSQLGTFRYKEKYPNGTPFAVPDNAPGSIYFPQTGKWLGGRFLEYWQAHGGIPQQGYPISDEFTEVSDLDGKPYTVQYFERAEFELHPENQPPNDVLLSLLGTFRYKEKYPGK